MSSLLQNLEAKIHQQFNIPYRLQTHSAGNGPVVILLHGIATSSKNWHILLPLLTPHYRCITIDLIGFGDSPKPDWYNYTPKEHLDSLHYTIKKLKLKQPYILVGHSMGSLLAASYARKYPKEVRRLVMLSSPIYKTKAEAAAARKIWRDALYAKAYQYLRTHKRFTMRGSATLKRLALLNNLLDIEEDTWLSFSKSLEECIEKQKVVMDLEKTTCPVDMMYGTHDRFLIKKNIKNLARLPNVSVQSFPAGHLIDLKYARVAAQRINSFS